MFCKVTKQKMTKQTTAKQPLGKWNYYTILTRLSTFHQKMTSHANKQQQKV